MSLLEAAPYGAELLDDAHAPPELVRESLRHIARANRWFGGAAAVRFGLRQAMAGRPAPASLTLLDVGTGLGDLPLMAVRWAARRGLALHAIGLERHGVAAASARAGGLPVVVGDGGFLPLRDRSVDLVLLSQVAHHFARAAIVRLLQECGRVARHAVIVADLRRSALAATFFPLAARALRFDGITRRDGVTSLRRGFTAATLQSLLSDAGLAARPSRRPGSRLVAVARIGGS